MSKGMTGKHHTEATKKKISEKQKGKHHSEETKKKLSEINKGRHLSEEAKRKMSERQKGEKSHFWKGGKVESTCMNCGNSFYYFRSRSYRKYCSHDCYWLSLIGIKQSEEACIKRSLKRGSDHPNWKGGISRVYKTGYGSRQFKKWRTEVFERDNYTCQKCGQHGGYLTAHHIKSFTHYPEVRFSANNGLTLCADCHSKTDNFGCKAKWKKEDNLRVS